MDLQGFGSVKLQGTSVPCCCDATVEIGFDFTQQEDEFFFCILSITTEIRMMSTSEPHVKKSMCPPYIYVYPQNVLLHCWGCYTVKEI